MKGHRPGYRIVNRRRPAHFSVRSSEGKVALVVKVRLFISSSRR
jgi:hypothetical protein